MAAVEAGMPLAVGFLMVGFIGAIVGHIRWTIEQERKNADFTISISRHFWMMGRACVMAIFVCGIVLLVWIEMRWPWTWGLIIGAISSVFANDAIEWMWHTLKAKANGRINL
jgi:hypothetical protein